MENITTNETLVTSVFALLVSAGDDIRLGEKARKNSESKIGGAYDTIMRAACEAGDWPTFEAATKALFDGIRSNMVRDDAPKGLAVLFGAEHGQDKDGNETETYTVPHSLSRAKTTVKKAFENSVSLSDEDGNPRTWNSVQEENKAIAKEKREAAEAQAEAEATATLSGDDLVRAECVQAITLIRESVAKATGGELADYHKALMVLAGLAETSAEWLVPEDDDDDYDAETAGEQLVATG